MDPAKKMDGKNVSRENSKSKGKKSYRYLAVMLIPVLAAIVLLVLTKTSVVEFFSGTPELKLVPPESVTALSGDEFVVDAVLTSMGEVLYPAASLVISFDKNYLEFTGIKMGNMMAYDNYNPLGNNLSGDAPLMIPQWSCNTQLSNQSGEIRTMYLDMTGGNNAYALAGFESGRKDILIRLGFRLRDSASAGTELKLEIKEAVLAATGGDENGTSLSSVGEAETLKVKGAVIAVK